LIQKPKKKSDLSNIKDSGRACVGCGRGPDQVMLMRLRTYSRSLACGACFIKYAKCENVNPVGTKCHHDPTDHHNKRGACKMAGCGCPRWVHGLENEFDRQLAAGIGVSPRMDHCTGFGVNLGKCGRMILAGLDGTISRLCDTCTRNWIRETQEGMKEVSKLLDLDEKHILPN